MTQNISLPSSLIFSSEAAVFFTSMTLALLITASIRTSYQSWCSSCAYQNLLESFYKKNHRQLISTQHKLRQAYRDIWNLKYDLDDMRAQRDSAYRIAVTPIVNTFMEQRGYATVVDLVHSDDENDTANTIHLQSPRRFF